MLDDEGIPLYRREVLLPAAPGGNAPYCAAYHVPVLEHDGKYVQGSVRRLTTLLIVSAARSQP